MMRGQREITCSDCGRTVAVESDWTYGTCPQCVAGITQPALRRCSRCGFYVQDWQTTSSYCKPCNSQYQRERRARLKTDGQMQWSVRDCTRCGVTEEIPPENGWCRQCRNRYQRQWKREHPDARKLPPGRTVPGREEMRQCSRCKRRRPYNRKEFVRGSICRRCYQGYDKTAAANEKEKFRVWRENAAPVECRRCKVVKPYGRGWDGRECPSCHSERMKEQYAEVKADPKRWKARKEQQEQARRRRQAKAVQDAENQDVSRSSAELDAKGREGP